MHATPIDLVILTGIFVLTAFFLVGVPYLVFLYQKKQHLLKIQLEAMRDKYEKEFLNSQLEIEEQNLRHISEELHENVGQLLSLAKLYLTTMDLSAESAVDKLDSSIEIMTNAIDELRNISNNFSLNDLKANGLANAARMLTQQLIKTGRYKIELIISGDNDFLEGNTEIFLFRILQESITNIIKHAEAEHLTIVLDYLSDPFTMRIKDDGKGFIIAESAEVEKSIGHHGGLVNMKNRATLINASFSIESRQGKGTEISVSVPFNQTP